MLQSAFGFLPAGVDPVCRAPPLCPIDENPNDCPVLALVRVQ